MAMIVVAACLSSLLPMLKGKDLPALACLAATVSLVMGAGAVILSNHRWWRCNPLAIQAELTPRRFQFSLRALLVTVTATALVAGVISWLAPETRFHLANLVLVIVCLFGMLATGVLTVAVVAFCYDRCRRMISREK